MPPAGALFIVFQPRDSTAFWPAFQKRWAELLCNQTEGLQSWIEESVNALNRGQTGVSDIAEARAALENMSARLHRAESVAGEVTTIEATSLAQFLSCGAAILSAHNSAADATNGAASYGRVRGILEQFKSLLAVLELSPSVVLGLADRDSQIIGRALALRLKLRYEDAVSEALGQSETIIVAADSRSLSAPTLARIFPEQILFAFNLHPLGTNLAPDIAGLSRFNLSLPWHLETAEPVAAVASEAEGNGEVAETPQREASSVAAQVAATRSVADPNWPARLEFYRARHALLTAGNPRLVRLPMLPGS